MDGKLHDSIRDFIMAYMKIKDSRDNIISEARILTKRRPDIVGIPKNPIHIDSIEARKYLVIEVKTGKRESDRVQQVAIYLALVRAYDVINNKALEAKYEDAVGIIIRTRKLGVLRKFDTYMGPIYLVTPDKLDLFKPLLPLVDDVEDEHLEEALRVVKEAYEEARGSERFPPKGSSILRAIAALREAVRIRRDMLIDIDPEAYRHKIEILNRYLSELSRMSNILAMSSKKYPVRGSALLERDEEYSRAEVLEALRDGRLLLLDADDVIALYLKNLLEKRDFRLIVSEGYYKILSVEDIKKLFEKGVIDKGDLKRLIENGYYEIRNIDELKSLYEAHVLDKEDIKWLIEKSLYRLERVDDLKALHASGIMDKSDIKWILERGYYEIRNIDELKSLYEAHVLDKEDIKWLIERGVYIPKDLKELKRLSSIGFSEEEIEELREKIIQRFLE